MLVIMRLMLIAILYLQLYHFVPSVTEIIHFMTDPEYDFPIRSRASHLSLNEYMK